MTPLVGGQQSNKYAFWRANVAIKKENGLVPPCSILLPGVGFWLVFRGPGVEVLKFLSVRGWGIRPSKKLPRGFAWGDGQAWN